MALTSAKDDLEALDNTLRVLQSTRVLNPQGAKDFETKIRAQLKQIAYDGEHITYRIMFRPALFTIKRPQLLRGGMLLLAASSSSMCLRPEELRDDRRDLVSLEEYIFHVPQRSLQS